MEHRFHNVTSPSRAKESFQVQSQDLKWLATNIQNGDVHQSNALFPYAHPGSMKKNEAVMISYILCAQEGLESDMYGKVPEDCTAERYVMQ